MLFQIAIILIILWVLGLVTGVVLHGFIHALLLIALAVIIYRLITGRAPPAI